MVKNSKKKQWINTNALLTNSSSVHIPFQSKIILKIKTLNVKVN